MLGPAPYAKRNVQDTRHINPAASSSSHRAQPGRRQWRTPQDTLASYNSYGSTASVTDSADEFIGARGQEELEEQEENEDTTSAGENEDNEDITPLLPIFSADHLDNLPVYNITHAIRELVIARCETVLTWDQLRSPQVSQFLLKPIQHEIETNYFNAATESALLANCLQFTREIASQPGNSGTCHTRAMLCELLAIRFLRYYSSRELIDTLSYDFNPLQGQDVQLSVARNAARSDIDIVRRQARHITRISCYELALRTEAKRFLAHPVVVRQLEAIWAGTIVFHSAADNLHRKKPTLKHQSYGTIRTTQSAKSVYNEEQEALRRVVAVYNPEDASLFKLSRLRVPRYRNILSTLSFAVLLALFLAVLIQRSLEITTLEVVFWIWSAGYMLDEVVGFSEQGFHLYLASFWNVFDLGILLILVVHFSLRLYGIVTPNVRKHTTANMAYDVLAADAILLFPRLFSVLDHSKYFSQLLIAFRLMARDLIAVFLLILISCSGFFVSLSLSFGNGDLDTPSSVAYALLQMLMGFTPAAWDRWDAYNSLGKTILTLFLFICHFLVVTILITVLTNSFMAIVRNAHEEHQFLFAVNTISSVKSDALFSYVAPANVVQWIVTPLRYFVPFRQYVKVNRTIIKVTHFPILFTIYLYESTILRSSVYDSIDIIEIHGRRKQKQRSQLGVIREPSIATVRQDRALEEVFRQPVNSALRSAQPSRDRRQTSNVVNTWMQDIDDDAMAVPLEQDHRIINGLEYRRTTRHRMRRFSSARNFTRRVLSTTSDPEETTTQGTLPRIVQVNTPSTLLRGEVSQYTGADDNDELVATTGIGNRDDRVASDTLSSSPIHEPAIVDRGSTPVTYLLQNGSTLHQTADESVVVAPSMRQTPERESSPRIPAHSGSRTSFKPHMRTTSSATMIYRPTSSKSRDEPQPSKLPKNVHSKPFELLASGSMTPTSKPSSSGTGRKTAKRTLPPHVRPMFPDRSNTAFHSAPNLAGLANIRKPRDEQQQQRAPSLEMDLVSDIGDNKAIGGGYVGAIPASFATQMLQATSGKRQSQQLQQQQQKEEQDMFGRLMMARMNGLEESFREVIHEMRETLRKDNNNNTNNDRSGSSSSSKSRSKSRSRPRFPRPVTGRKKRGSPKNATFDAASSSSVDSGRLREQAAGE